jgi:hypothetical protein
LASIPGGAYQGEFDTMPHWFEDNAQQIGRTPLIRLNRMTDGTVEIFVSGAGTGGTITGVSRNVKNSHGKCILSVAVESSASPVLTQKLSGEPHKKRPHKIQGIAA